MWTFIHGYRLMNMTSVDPSRATVSWSKYKATVSSKYLVKFGSYLTA
jgi:hypothetical protein